MGACRCWAGGCRAGKQEGVKVTAAIRALVRELCWLLGLWEHRGRR